MAYSWRKRARYSMGGNSLGRSLPADQQAQIRLLGEAGFLHKISTMRPSIQDIAPMHCTKKASAPHNGWFQKRRQKLSHGKAFLFCEPGRGFRGGAPNKGIMLAGFNACYSLKSQSPALLECVFYANTNTFFAVNLDSNTRSRYTEINQKK